jgi:mannitol-specific phosphotransferase system IIBC component
MRSEPTAIIEVVRVIALLLTFAGVTINAEEQAALAAGIAAIGVIVSIGLAIWNRLRVFSPKTVEGLVEKAADNALMGKAPPAVNPPGR